MANFEIIRHRVRDTDNYNYLLKRNQDVLWVDPYHPLALLKRIRREELVLQGILITHTHWDHIDGVEQVREKHDVPVYVHPVGVPDLKSNHTVPVDEGSKIALGDIKLSVYHVPGHHPAHLLYHGGGVAVLGDLLFAFGCGSPLFGGNAPDIHNSLLRLNDLLSPNDKLLWGHNYDMTNLLFALHHVPEDPLIQPLSQELHRFAVEPFPEMQTWQEQRAINPFLRVTDSEFGERLQRHFPDAGQSPMELFLALREARNQWRGEP